MWWSILAGLVRSGLRPVLPPDQRWVARVLAVLVERIPQEVASARRSSASGASKRSDVVARVSADLDRLDSIPGWSRLSEGRRDRVIAAVCELVLLAVEAVDGQLPEGPDVSGDALEAR
jgi:hypothetical protein